MDDPRTGAFGVISVFCLLLLKVGVIYEMLLNGHEEIIPFIIFIPFIARLGTLIYFLTMQTAKQTGLAAYFKSIIIPKKLMLIISVFSIVFMVAWIYFSIYSLFILVIVMLLSIFFYRKWSQKHFGGMSGDLLGALGEGVEVVLWLTVLLCI